MKILDKPQTTTVWIFSNENFEKQLDENIIGRYSKDDSYSIITFIPHSENKIDFLKDKELLFIKSPFLSSNLSHLIIKQYLKEIKEIVDRGLPSIRRGGFLVIQTQDVRIDGYIEPLAKRIIDILVNDDLWLKEIIVATKQGLNLNSQESIDYLKIVHQYLLVYDRK